MAQMNDVGWRFLQLLCFCSKTQQPITLTFSTLFKSRTSNSNDGSCYCKVSVLKSWTKFLTCNSDKFSASCSATAYCKICFVISGYKQHLPPSNADSRDIPSKQQLPSLYNCNFKACYCNLISTSRHAALRRDCPSVRPRKPRRWRAWHRDFGLPATTRALYSGPQQPVCARRLPPVRPCKLRAWPHISTIRLLYYI